MCKITSTKKVRNFIRVKRVDDPLAPLSKMNETRLGEVLPVTATIAACFGVSKPKSLAVRPFRDTEISVVHLDRSANQARLVNLPPDDAYLITLYLVDVEHRDVPQGGSATAFRVYHKGSICLIDLKPGAAIEIRGQFEALAFHIPRRYLDELSAHGGEPPVAELRTCRGTDDEVVESLGAALTSMFDIPRETRSQALTHIVVAFGAHLIHRYGRPATDRPVIAGGSSSVH